MAGFDREGRSINGTVNVSADEARALLDEGSLTIRPTSTDWVYDNRGTIFLQGDASGERDGQIRDIEIRMDDGGLFAATLTGIPLGLDGPSHTEGLGVTIAGRMLASCFDIDEVGSVRADPNSSEALCRGFASE